MYFYRHGKVKKFCVNFLQAKNKKKLLAFTKYRSIFVPTHGYRGTLYRVNECILAQDDSLDDMIILKISSIFSTKLSKYQSFVTGEVYSHAADSSGDPMYHSYSDNPYVEPTSTVKVLRSTAILRKVMLYPDPDMLYNPSKYIVIDYLRPIIPLDKNDVIVPHYPEEGDMISVKGIGSDVYLAHIQSVNRIQKTCQVYFYERDTANISERKYKRVKYAEKSALVIHFRTSNWSVVWQVLDSIDSLDAL